MPDERELDAQDHARRRVALAQIRQYPDAVLRMPARPVEQFNDDLARLADKMAHLMRDAHGVGLAATQVGVLQRLFVFQVADEEDVTAIVNPEITKRSRAVTVEDEGCLSLQGVLVPVERAVDVTIEGQDLEGAPLRLELDEMNARVVQHELDHLDGVLILERTTDEARRGALATLRKTLRRALGVASGVRIAVAATAPFGADVLERLAARHDVATLLTRPDRPAGRGRKVAAPPAKVAAERLGIPVLQPERPTAELELPADTVVVVAYGLLIPETLLERGLWLNVHPSLLPRWRGAAPVERALLAGDTETGVTIHETVKELDAGPIAAQQGFLLTPDDDAGTVYERAAELAAELLDEVLPDPVFRPQEGEASYAAKIEPDDRILDLSRPVESLNRIRALSPHIGARGELQGRPVTIWRARLEDGELVPEEVQPEGGTRMPYEDFLRGLR